MKIHQVLMKITVIHAILCFAAFYFLNRAQQDDGEIVINGALGWIFWLGMFTIIAPIFISDATRKTLYTRPYFLGFILFAVVNILIPLVCANTTAYFFID